MPTTKYGYARVSTADQNPDMQTDALRKAGCDRQNIFVDRGVSGKFSNRPALDRCLAKLQPGDMLMVWKLDRLGRDTHDLLGKVKDLKGRGVEFRSLTESIIDTTSPQGDLIFQIFAAFSQFERGLLLERTNEGRVRHKKRIEDGDPKAKPFGAPPRLDKTQKIGVASMYKGGKTIDFIAGNYRVSRATVYRALREMLPARFPKSKKKLAAQKAVQETQSREFIRPDLEALISADDPVVRTALEREIGMTQHEAIYQLTTFQLPDKQAAKAAKQAKKKDIRSLN